MPEFSYSEKDHAATGVKAITASDTTVIRPTPVAIMANVAGNVALVFADGTEATLTIVAGQIYPFQVEQIKATGTTATGLHGFYN